MTEQLAVNFSAMGRLVSASALLLAGRMAGAGANFFFALMLAHALPLAEVGAAFTLIATAFLASNIVTLNIDSGSIRFLVAAREADDAETASDFIVFGRRLLFCAAPVVAAGFLVVSLAAGGAATWVPALFGAASVPVMGWLRLSGAHATALGRPAIGSLPATALQPVILLCIFPAALAMGAPATAATVLACFFGANLAGAAVQLALLRKHIRAVAVPARRFADWRSWILNGLYLAPSKMLQEHLQHAIVLAASLALGHGEVAILAISLRFISLVRFGVLSINMAVSPDIARAMTRADAGERDAHLKMAAIIKVPATAAALAAIIYFAGPILSLFGPEYAEGRAALAWLALIPLTSAILGPNFLLLNICGERRIIFGASLAAILGIFIAAPVFGAWRGAAGAAMAAALVFAVWELTIYVFVRLKLKADASFLGAIARGR